MPRLVVLSRGKQAKFLPNSNFDSDSPTTLETFRFPIEVSGHIVARGSAKFLDNVTYSD